MADPDFWQDNETAQKILKERSTLQNLLENFNKYQLLYEDTQELYQLICSEQDEEMLDELVEDLPRLEEGIEGMEFQRMLSGRNDKNNAIVSINSGAGGTESQDWVDMLLRMYLRYCEKQGYSCQVVDQLDGEEAGLKNVTFIASGEYAYGKLKAEIGIHRLVRISPFDSNARRHTSFASVFVLPELEDDIDVEVNETDLRIDTYRASGAGGQHVNKTSSAVRITHIPTNIVVQCQNERSQFKNKSMAMKILKARLYESEMEQRAKEMDEMNADKKDIAWGSQIRSYVLHPYRMVKDHRTKIDVGNVDAVLDGELDRFIKQYLISN